MNKKIFQGILLILFWLNLQATTDSLRYQLGIADHDSVRVKTLFALGNNFIDGPSDSLLHYYFRSLGLITTNLENNPVNSTEYLTFKKLEYRARLELGIEYFFRSEFDRALEYFYQTEQIAEYLQNKCLLSESYSEIGIVLKNQGLTSSEEKMLRKKKLIEGRKPNYYISLKVAQKTGQKAIYTTNKAFDNQYYLDLIVKSVKQHKALSNCYEII